MERQQNRQTKIKKVIKKTKKKDREKKGKIVNEGGWEKERK